MAYAGFLNLGACWSRAPFVDITPAVYGRYICDSARKELEILYSFDIILRVFRLTMLSHTVYLPFAICQGIPNLSAKTHYANSSPTSLSLISQSLLAFSLSAAKGAGSTTWQFSRYAPECSAQTLSAPHDLISRSYEGEGALPSSAGSNAATTCVAEPCP